MVWLESAMRVVAASALLLAAATASAQDDDSPVARGRRLFETVATAVTPSGAWARRPGRASRGWGPSTRASTWRAGSGRHRRAGRSSTCRSSIWPSPSSRRWPPIW